MKIAFYTTPESIELANMVIARAVEELTESAEKREAFNVSVKDVKLLAKMREAMLKGFLNPAKPRKKKIVKPAEKKAKHSCYKDFIDIYWDWFNQVEKIPPNIDVIAGASANKIIDYLKTIVRARFKHNNEPGEISEAELNARVLESWKLILTSWDSLEKFLKEKTKLSEIYSNIQNIILKVKNAARNQSNGKQAATASGTMQAISNKYNKRTANK